MILVLVGLASRCSCAGSAAATHRQPDGRGLTWRRPTTAPTPTARAGAAQPARAGAGPTGSGLAGWLWLAIVIIPIYWIFITSFKTAERATSRPTRSLPPRDPTLDNYRLVIESDFLALLRSTASSSPSARSCPAVLFSFMAAFAIVRGGGSRFLRSVNALFLMGLAIPLQAASSRST